MRTLYYKLRWLFILNKITNNGYIYYALLIALFCIFGCTQRNNNVCYIYSSNVELNHCDSILVENLTLLCKVWGFTKYYHPLIINSGEEWDIELFRMLPKAISAKSVSKLSDDIHLWLEQYKVESQTNQIIRYSADSIMEYPDIKWIEDESQLGQLSQILKSVKYAERVLPQRAFLDTISGRGTFRGESFYHKLEQVDVGYRLLSLFRFWNVVQYFYPYKSLFFDSWESVLREFIPYFIKAENNEQYTALLLRLAARMNDSHIRVVSKDVQRFFGEKAAGYVVSFVEQKPVIIGSVNAAVLKRGDILRKINGETIDQIIERLRPYIAASNKSSFYATIAQVLLCSNLEMINVEFERNGEVINKMVPCNNHPIRSHISVLRKKEKCFQLISDSIALIYPDGLSNGEIPDNINAKGLIIDLRCYPNHRIKGYHNFDQIYNRRRLCAKFTESDVNYAGLYYLHGNDSIGRNTTNYFSKKVIVIINAQTASYPEYMAMRYKMAPNVTIIGEVSGCANGGVMLLPLPGGASCNITLQGVYFPNGDLVQKTGIIPDIHVSPTIKGIQDNRDELLEKAVMIILEQDEYF